MSFLRYPKYKSSGVKWLGDVPEHWDAFTLRRSLLEHRQGYYTKDSYVDSGVKLLRITDLRDFGDVEFSECPRVENRQELEPYLLRESDFVFARTGGAGTFGLIGELTEPIAYASYLIRFRFTDAALPRFLRHYFLSANFQNAVRQNIHGGVNQNVHAEDIKNQYIALPPRDEQTVIASFLDRETSKIDGLVGEQRRLIELLKEKRQAVISHAVTKGLNPHAPLKPSGIEWLGDVPEHWRDGVKLKTLAKNQPASFTNGPFGSDLLTSELQSDGVPVIYIRDLKVGGYCRTSSSYVTEDKAQQLNKFRVDTHDVLIAKVGDPPGFCCTYPVGERAGIICQDVIRMKPNLELVSPHFLCFLLNSQPGIESVDSICIELTRKRFSLADLHSLRFPMPPRPEQDEIVQHLNTVTANFDALTAEAERGIELLQERRTALISAAVTGQIDVRNFVNRESVP